MEIMSTSRTPQILSGTYSFLLPGLVQLYSRHFAKALFFFLLFSSLIFFPKTRLLTPLVVFVAAGDAYRFAVSVKSSAFRDWFYALIGFLGFLSWILIF